MGDKWGPRLTSEHGNVGRGYDSVTVAPQVSVLEMASEQFSKDRREGMFDKGLLKRVEAVHPTSSSMEGQWCVRLHSCV